jgi:hypothetical protein
MSNKSKDQVLDGLSSQIIDLFPYSDFSAQYTLTMVNKAFDAEIEMMPGDP